MRILFSNSSFNWGGVHLITDLLATGLDARGHQILILCRPGSVLQARLQERFECVSIAKGMDFSPLAVARIAYEINRFRPDVVLSLMDKDLRLTGPAARILGVPLVSRRANDRPLRDGPYHRFVYGTLATAHVANSAATRRSMLDSAPWLRPDRVRVIYNGIDAAAIAAAPPAGLPVPAHSTTVGFIARLETRKGVLDLLDAWPAVVAAQPKAHLVIAGRGPLEQEVARRVLQMVNAHFLGYRSDVANILNSVDILAMPSHWEGFGLVAAEAMAAGTPVVAANASSLPELIDDGVEGILVPPRDPGALADAIARLVRDPALRTAMGDRGRERVHRQFAVARMIDDYEEILRATATGG
ncbi:MAG: glycosyltransferase family 4 protein [Longimicrobiales bacterium]